MLFQEYTEFVFEDYSRKSAESLISLNLIHPTAARLKEECIRAYSRSANRRDENILISFFGTPQALSNMYQLIERCDPDKFRPLEYYLKKRTTTTDHKNIELLAWLIDFEDRPYDPRKPLTKGNQQMGGPGGNGDAPSTTGPTIKSGISGGNIQGPPVIIDIHPPPTKPGSKIRIRITIAILSLLLVISAFAFWQINRRQYDKNYAKDSQCMYWAVDRYLPISCNQKLDNTLIVALDSVKLKDFRKITRTDTITLNSIGKVWYLKKGDSLEFFTMSGFHPVHHNIKLKPLTAYMIKTHILSGQ